MIQLLVELLAAEVGVTLVLLVKPPFRKLLIMGLDRLKRGWGPVMVRTVAGALVVALASSLCSMAEIQTRSSEIGALSPTDQVLMSRHLLEASLMGYSLLLGLIIHRLHHYIGELCGLRKILKSEADARAVEIKAAEEAREQIKLLKSEAVARAAVIKAAEEGIAKLREHIKLLKSEAYARAVETKAAEEAREEEIAKLRKQIKLHELEAYARAAETKAAEEEIAKLRKQIKLLESEAYARAVETRAAEEAREEEIGKLRKQMKLLESEDGARAAVKMAAEGTVEEHSDTGLLFTIAFPPSTPPIRTTVTSSPSDVTAWLSSTLSFHRGRLDGLIVGLDVEWCPQNPISVLQLCVGRRCLVFQILHSPSIPPELPAFLADPRFAFVGVGVCDDAKRIADGFGIEVRNLVDLRDLAAETMGNKELKQAGLARLAKEVMGVHLVKKRRARRNWEKKVLSWNQVIYACLDAFFSFEIGRRLYDIEDWGFGEGK